MPDDSNPLLTPRFRIPFDRIRAEHVEPAIAELLQRRPVRAWKRWPPRPGPRTFDNTMGALDELTEPLDYAMGVVRHLESVATYPELRAAFNAVQPEVSAFYSGIPLHEGLWKGLKEFAATPEGARAHRARAAASWRRPWTPSAATAPSSTRQARSASKRSTSS